MFGAWKRKVEHALVDIGILDFGRKKPAYADVTIRAPNSFKETKKPIGEGVRSALDAADVQKRGNHRVTDKAGRRVINAEFFPLVFSVFGGISKESEKFFARVKEKAPDRVERFRDVLAIRVVQMIAHRLREGVAEERNPKAAEESDASESE